MDLVSSFPTISLLLTYSRKRTLRPSLANFSFNSSPVRPFPSISNIAFSTPGKFNPRPVLPIGPTTPPVIAFVVFVEVEDGRVRNDCLGSFVSFCSRSSCRERNDCSGSEVVVIVLTSFAWLSAFTRDRKIKY
jgi:hypothetical protein